MSLKELERPRTTSLTSTLLALPPSSSPSAIIVIMITLILSMLATVVAALDETAPANNTLASMQKASCPTRPDTIGQMISCYSFSKDGLLPMFAILFIFVLPCIAGLASGIALVFICYGVYKERGAIWESICGKCGSGIECCKRPRLSWKKLQGPSVEIAETIV